MRDLFRFVPVLPILVCCALGCGKSGPPLAKVGGNVTLNGKPVTAGIVIFQSADGLVNVMGDLDANGNYELKTHDAAGIAPGKYRISLKPPAPNYETPPLADAGQRDPRPQDKTIAQRYWSADTSGLTADVTLEKTQYDLQLTP